MKILITGGCGFLGSNLASDAMQRGHHVTIFDNLSRFGAVQNLEWLRDQGECLFVHGDIRNENDVEGVVSNYKPEVIFHLAGQVAMTTSIADPRLDFDVNARGSFNLLDAVRRNVPGAAILYSSTNKVYGDLEQYEYREDLTRYIAVDYPHGFDETVPLNFHSPYGCSKGAADQYMLDFARMFGLRTVVFRHSSMYGGRQFATYDQGWVGWFCRQAVLAQEERLDKAFTISGNGKQVRDVLHAEDISRLYFSAVDNIDSISGDYFNIGGGAANSLSILELLEMLSDICGVALKYDRLPARESDQRVFIADVRKAKRLLGWQPQVSARAGVEAMVNWIRKQV